MKYPEDFINKVIFGNNKDILNILPNKSVDCICTDPPYYLDPGGSCGGIAAKREYIKEISDNEIDVGFDYNTLKEYERILKSMNLITFCGRNDIREYLNWSYEGGYRWKLITWHKTNPTPLINGNYLPDTEFIFHFWDGMKIGGNYETKRGYYISPVIKNIYEHPTVKPLKIVENLIINATKEWDVVLDPYAGTGTTLVACKELNRNFIGIEKVEKYVEICHKRISEIKNKKSLFDDWSE